MVRCDGRIEEKCKRTVFNRGFDGIIQSFFGGRITNVKIQIRNWVTLNNGFVFVCRILDKSGHNESGLEVSGKTEFGVATLEQQRTETKPGCKETKKEAKKKALPGTVVHNDRRLLNI